MKALNPSITQVYVGTQSIDHGDEYNMPYITNHRVKIHYEIEGRSPPLVLHHGLTNNLQGWRLNRYTDALKTDYRLILVDARGHGDSAKPHDFHAYSLELMSGDVMAILDDVHVEQASFWGYSMGARVGFNLSQYHPTRFNAFILGGQSPFPRRSETEHHMHRISRSLRIGAEEGSEAVLAFEEALSGQKASIAYRQRVLRNDYRALYTLWQNFMTWPYTGYRVSKIAVPCLLYAGDQDPTHAGMKEAAQHIPDACFVSLPDMGHVEAFFGRHRDQSKMIVLTTSGDGGWLPDTEGRNFDAISSASQEDKVDVIADEIIAKIRSLLQKE